MLEASNYPTVIDNRLVCPEKLKRCKSDGDQSVLDKILFTMKNSFTCCTAIPLPYLVILHLLQIASNRHQRKCWQCVFPRDRLVLHPKMESKLHKQAFDKKGHGIVS